MWNSYNDVLVHHGEALCTKLHQAAPGGQLVPAGPGDKSGKSCLNNAAWAPWRLQGRDPGDSYGRFPGTPAPGYLHQDTFPQGNPNHDLQFILGP